MPEALDKSLIAARRPDAIPAGTPLGRIIAKLHSASVAYRYWHPALPSGGAGPRELAGSGRLIVETAEGQLHCRVHGDLFKPGPFEFVFHQFWLTRRGMIHAVFDLAENRPPANRSASETYLHFTNLPDRAIQREAVAFRERPRGGKDRKPS